MNFLELSADRFSCRKFTDEQLSDEELNGILEVGRLAPSAINRQPWRFLVVQSQSGLEKVDKCTKCRYGAPTAVLVCFNVDESAKNEEVVPDYGWVDCGIAVGQMVLEAKSAGIDSCIVGAYDPQAVRSEFNMPENIIPYQFIMFGHADQPPARMHYDRKPLQDIVVRESF